jgi:hypothetical protein
MLQGKVNQIFADQIHRGFFSGDTGKVIIFDYGPDAIGTQHQTIIFSKFVLGKVGLDEQPDANGPV